MFQIHMYVYNMYIRIYLYVYVYVYIHPSSDSCQPLSWAFETSSCWGSMGCARSTEGALRRFWDVLGAISRCMDYSPNSLKGGSIGPKD